MDFHITGQRKLINQGLSNHIGRDLGGSVRGTCNRFSMFSGYSLILWVGGRVVTIALEVFEDELLDHGAQSPL